MPDAHEPAWPLAMAVVVPQTMRTHRRLLVCFIAAATLLAVAVPAGVLLAHDSTVGGRVDALPPTAEVATIDGLPVTLREFRLVMENEAVALTYGHFAEAYAATRGSDFWTSSHGGTRPIDYAIDLTLQSLVTIRVEKELAQERGIAVEPDYSTFVSGWQAENERRRAALSTGEPIFGPDQYSEYQYYLLIHQQVRATLTAAIANEVPEQQVAQEWEQFRARNQSASGAPLEYAEVEGGLRTVAANRLLDEQISAHVHAAHIVVDRDKLSQLDMG